ncbi:hypothetical protein TNCV_3442891 [Trichonephila clavipes]|nr:hypothetical protein TNCV_3442891 [Trichonephila clavipes]
MLDPPSCTVIMPPGEHAPNFEKHFFSPTQLLVGDNRLARLIPTPKRHLVHHLVALNHLFKSMLKGIYVPTGHQYSSFMLFAAQICERSPSNLCCSLKLPSKKKKKNVVTKDKLLVG